MVFKLWQMYYNISAYEWIIYSLVLLGTQKSHFLNIH